MVSIKGEKDTAAIVDRAYPADVGEPIARVDGIIRRNAKTGIGEYVTIKKIDVKEAKKGDEIGIKVNDRVRPNDKVFLIA